MPPKSGPSCASRKMLELVNCLAPVSRSKSHSTSVWRGGAEAQAGDERRDVAGFGEEGDAGERERGVEDVAAVVDDGAAEGGVEEVALGEPPGEPLLLRGFGLGSQDLAAMAWVRMGIGGGVGDGDAVGVEVGGSGASVSSGRSVGGVG